MATKHPAIRVGDLVVTKATLKAMLLKVEETERKAGKEAKETKETKETKGTSRKKRPWAVRVTDSEKVALSAVLAVMRINN